MTKMDDLEIAYTVDLLARLTESIETYLDDDRWDGIDVMYQEIKEANKLVRKYYKRMSKQVEQEKHDDEMTMFIKMANRNIENEGL